MNKITMDNEYVIIEDCSNSNNIRVIAFEEWLWDYENDCPVLLNKCYKLQIKVYGFLMSRYVDIKEWKFDCNNEDDDEFAKNEAIELFNNIINPYKYGNI